MKKTLLAFALISLACGAAHADTLKKIKDSGKVVMGVRDSSSPLSFTLGSGQYAGYHVELCQRVIADIGKQLSVTPTIEYTSVTAQNRIPLVQNGTVDIECGSTTNNQARQEQVAFAVTTYITEVRMAVNAKSGIDSIAQLNNRTVVTTTGTTSVQHLRRHQRAENVKFGEIFGKDHADSFLILESGRAHAVVMDDNILAGAIANARNPSDFKIVGEVLSVEPIAIMIRKDDPGFKKAVDDSIRAMMKNGELAKLYAKWFTQPIPPKNVNVNLPMGESLKAAFASPNDNPMESYARK